MGYYGYAGCVLFIDLTENTVHREPLDLELTKKYIGGMGINSKLVYDLIKDSTDPLSPENVLIYGAGPFVGTLIPGASRGSIISKSPLTGLIGETGAGSSIGIMLKYAGYDHLVIKGKARQPVYIAIDDDSVEIKDASDIWGLDVFEATDAVRAKLGKDFWVSCIGTAGEKMVKIASIIDNKNAMFARTGLGAVAGSKNLKAVAVRGTKGINVFRKKEFLEAVDNIRQKVSSGPLVSIWRQEKIIDSYMGEYLKRGIYLTKNFSEGLVDGTIIFSAKEYRERFWSNCYACPGCPVGDKGVLKVRDGKYSGLYIKLSNPWGTPMSFQACGIRNWDDGIKCAELCNRYGIDAFSASNLIAFAIELYEKGIINKKDTFGLELKWNSDTVFKLIDLISNKEGFGAILSEGIVKACKIIGRDCDKYAVHVKGLSPMMDLRESIFVENFGQIVDPRGGHHSRGYSITYVPKKVESIRRYASLIGVPDEHIQRICSAEGYSVPRLLKWVNSYNSTAFSLGLCMRPQISAFYDLSRLKQLLYLTTGLDIKREDLLKAGERIWNVQRIFNVREGASRKDDKIPYKMLNQEVKVGDKVLPPIGNVENLLDEYYDECGWDIKTGIPTKEKLRELGIN